MDTDDYLPRVLDESFQSVAPSHTDPSKWDAVHDALENSSLHHHDSSRPTRGTGSLFTVAWVLGITLGLIWVLRNGRSVFDQWQQNVHRRANRRRHGIPDDDDRPFNVAYAAAALARRQREKEQAMLDNARREKLQAELDWQQPDERLRQRGSHAQDPRTSTQRPQPILPQSMDVAAHGTPHEHMETNGTAYQLQSRPQPASNLTSTEPWLTSVPYNPNRGHDQGQSAAQLGVLTTAANRRISHNVDHTPSERRKHRYVDDTDDEDRTSKRTRVAGEELIDGDNDATWMPGGSRRGSVQLGSKRHANLEDDDNWEMSRDKRARMGHLSSHDVGSGAEEFSDVEMARESSDAEPENTRGTKREREELVADYSTNDGDELPVRPLRKRRSENGGSTRMPSSRGIKRDRSPQRSSVSDEDDVESSGQMGRQKRGRRHEEPEPDSDVISANASLSDELPEIAEDPACGGRRIGEVWEVNGQSFKVGLDGRRLRHALVRLQRSKFAMPKDSTHNDARTSVDVVVEKWLNDDEYKAAKENFELAWQDPSPSSTPGTAEVQKQEVSPSGGKRLLWGGPPPSPVKGRASMSSVQNPFDLAPHSTGRRIASAHLLMNQPAESPKLRSSKSFSKWEKQDLEASSLKKMRARIEKEKEEKEREKKEKEKQKEKEEAQQKEQQVKEKAKTAGTTITPLTSATNTQGPLPPSFDMKPVAPPSQNLFATPATSQPSGSAPTFSFTKPESASSVPAPTSPAKPSGSTPAFTFTKPEGTSSIPAPTSPAKPSGSTPAFTFTKPEGGSSIPAPTSPAKPATSPFSFQIQGAATSSTAATPSAAKPSFSFTPPPATLSTPLSDANKGVAKPSFSFAPPPSTDATAKPAFSFGPPTQVAPATPPAVQAGKTEPAKPPAFSFTTPPANLSASVEPTKAPAFSFATPPINKPTSMEPGKGEPPKAPAFSFATPPASAEPNKNPTPMFNPFTKSVAQPAAAPTINGLPFAFNPNPQQQQQPSQAANARQAGSSSGSGSLLDRLAPNPAAATQTAQTQAASTSTVAVPSAFGDGQTTTPFKIPSNTNTTAFPTATGIFGQGNQPQQPQSGPQSTSSFAERSADKPPATFGLAPQPPKNIFGQPPAAFSFKPSPTAGAFADPQKAAGQDAASQTKTPFSFGFANPGTGGATAAAAAASPFQPLAGAGTAGGAQTSPARNPFTFGQSSFTPPSPATFGFTNKAATDSEKK